MPDLPDKEQELLLHRKLLEGYTAVTDDIASIYVSALQKHLKRKFPQTEETLVWDAVSETLLNFFERPQSYDPTKRGLFGYLKMSAEGDLINLLEKEKRRKKRVVRLDAVEFLDLDGNSNLEEQYIARQEASDKIIQLYQQHINDANAITFDETERKVLALMDSGERRTEVYAEVLGITHLPKAEQAKQVKNYKDRLNLRRKRSRAKTDKSGKKKKDE